MNPKRSLPAKCLKTHAVTPSKTKREILTGLTTCSDATQRILARKSWFWSMSWSITDNSKLSTMPLANYSWLPSTSAVFASLYALLSDQLSCLSQTFMTMMEQLSLSLLTSTMKSFKSLTSYLCMSHLLPMSLSGRMAIASISL